MKVDNSVNEMITETQFKPNIVLHTVKQVAEILMIRQQSVYDLVAQGYLESYRLGPKTIRISMKQLSDYLDKHKK